jgi:stage II sporulation protein D
MASPINQKLLIGKIQIVIILAMLWLGLIPSHAQAQIYIRVLVLEDMRSANLEIHGYYEILDGQGKNILYKGRDLHTTLLTGENGIFLGEINLGLSKVFIKPEKYNIIKIDGREFRGDIQIIKKEHTNKFCAINFIELEEYVKGVLYHEVSHHWPMEALKAQALVSRTFALYQHQTNKDRDYDVTADIYSQVYGGKTSERYRTNAAVVATEGKIITYRGEVFATYYSATCAGQTEAAANLWNVDIEPLKGVECKFCTDSPHYRWHEDISLPEIKEGLNKTGLGITGQIRDIKVIKRNKSGRVERIKIYSDKKETEISGKDFRSAMGPNTIRSTNFTVEIMQNDAYFEGFGWGHGVGMCQWGAYFMAKQGYKYEEIIKYYYPAAEISLVSK